MDKVKFEIVFKKGVKTLALVEGDAKDIDHLTVRDITERVIEAEQFLERLTGLRVHININVNPQE